jgi:hypothetical protein
MHRVRLSLLLALAALFVAAPLARAASPSLVVSQVFAAGGNAGASYANDYVELFNRGSSAVDLTGWTVQYAAAAGTTWQATPLSGSLPAGRHYLVQLASAAAIGAALPAPDAVGTTNLAVTGGKVAVVHGTSPLSCGATAGSCSAAAVDLVGYGGATDYEGSAPLAALGATTAAIRNGGGCVDTDANASDFAIAPAAPLGSATAAAPCAAAPSVEPVTAAAAVDIQIEPVLSIALERPTVSFGRAVSGESPAPVSERVTVLSNNAAGYALTVHRSAFTPSDLPLGIAVDAGPLTAIPVSPALDLLVGSTSAKSAAGGDVWPTALGFSALPAVVPGLYASTVTFTAIAR